ncbi:MAG: thermonuclease family protein [Alphaproteobacteria bacterium]|nr:thermonuclease family protein [Alphaproteobacteria bacterium]
MKNASARLLGFLCLIVSGSALAHDRALDRNGCHANEPWGGYHCHQGPLAGQYFRSRAEAERLLPRRPAQQRRRRARDPNHVFGRAKVVDGDTLEIRDERIRLYGIDAFHRRQRCRRSDGDRYRCGREAKRALERKVDNKRVACAVKERHRRRSVAVCWLDAEDIGAWMVLSGWAMADRTHGADYRIHERRAERRRNGAWSGEFLRPDAWRERRRERRRDRD